VEIGGAPIECQAWPSQRAMATAEVLPPALVKTPPAYTESGIEPKCATLLSTSTRPFNAELPAAPLPRWSHPPGPVADAPAEIQSDTTIDSASTTDVTHAGLAARITVVLLSVALREPRIDLDTHRSGRIWRDYSVGITHAAKWPKSGRW
jgi:hypothetical protein